ncbi:MAG: type I-MYXAN CRISPR-associated protein Cas5/Cmx5/DevS [Planctomycetaceae bacterium]|nr:type I-MYXAN CRISPR-associated protein Cas5/Cmx5/DevS [Planctomycetaceae bacterium]
MTETDALLLRVETPICAFRPFASREYQDTYPVPTPASVYGMLLSFLGIERDQKTRHEGVRMALALSPSREEAQTVNEALPLRSSVFRKFRRVSQTGYNKLKKSPDELDQFIVKARRPDYQDLLTDLELWVWLQAGDDEHDLPAALSAALSDPSSIRCRHGGLSLGESSYLVNSINCVTEKHLPPRVVALQPSEKGFYSLPVWTDHIHDRSRLIRFELTLTSPHPAWFTVAPRN